MTRKSHSLLMGAMIDEEREKCREKAASLGTAVADTLWPRTRNRMAGDSLTVIRIFEGYGSNGYIKWPAMEIYKPAAYAGIVR